MGIDDIPMSVLKKGVEVLAGLISHLVNRSLAEGCVPVAFKVGKVFPIFKGKGKAREDSDSYRPVSILPAMSKILETSVKADLEDHLARVSGLPGAQYGFRPKRSCTAALAHAHAGWLSGTERGQVVGIMAFNLCAPFDRVAAEQLLPKLQLLGVSGRALAWFKSYLTGGSQQVSWDGTLSDLIVVRYGRQGSHFYSWSSSATWQARWGLATTRTSSRRTTQRSGRRGRWWRRSSTDSRRRQQGLQSGQEGLA
jgi:hypothetical protein